MGSGCLTPDISSPQHTRNKKEAQNG